MTQLSRTASFGLPRLLMGLGDPVAMQTNHIATSGAEMRALFRMSENWGDHPLVLGETPIVVLTAGDRARFPGESWMLWHELHADLVAHSSSTFHEHRVVAGAGHYIHRTHLSAVSDAARNLAAHLKATSDAAKSAMIDKRQ